MKRRLSELMRTARQYKTKACGMHNMIGLNRPSSMGVESQRLQRKRMKRKPPVPTQRSVRSASRDRTHTAIHMFEKENMLSPTDTYNRDLSQENFS